MPIVVHPPPQTWHTTVERVTLKKQSAQIDGRSAAKFALERLVAILGNNQTAQLLGVATSQPSRWRRTEPISAENARHILDLDYLLSRLFISSLHRDEIGAWLTMAQPFLNGARPIDVLVIQGLAPVIHAIDAIDQGAYA